MKWWPITGPPASHVAPGDVCYIRNHVAVLPVFRGAVCVVVSGLKEILRPGEWMHLIECDVLPPGYQGAASPQYLIKQRPPDEKLESWEGCVFRPKALKAREEITRG